MYCELVNREVEFHEETINFGREDKTIRDCSENHKNINGVNIISPCRFRSNTKCLQLKNRIVNK